MPCAPRIRHGVARGFRRRGRRRRANTNPHTSAINAMKGGALQLLLLRFAGMVASQPVPDSGNGFTWSVYYPDFVKLPLEDYIETDHKNMVPSPFCVLTPTPHTPTPGSRIMNCRPATAALQVQPPLALGGNVTHPKLVTQDFNGRPLLSRDGVHSIDGALTGTRITLIAGMTQGPHRKKLIARASLLFYGRNSPGDYFGPTDCSITFQPTYVTGGLWRGDRAMCANAVALATPSLAADARAEVTPFAGRAAGIGYMADGARLHISQSNRLL